VQNAGLVAGIFASWRPILTKNGGKLSAYPAGGFAMRKALAERIYPPTHEFIENTVPSMQAAFEAGRCGGT